MLHFVPRNWIHESDAWGDYRLDDIAVYPGTRHVFYFLAGRELCGQICGAAT